MRNVFTDNKRKVSVPWKFIVPVACFALVFLIVVFGVANVSVSAKQEQQKAAEEAVRRAAVQCYVIEGRYPQNVDYLAKHYGLILNSGYSYHYRSIGNNLMPEIFVFPVE